MKIKNFWKIFIFLFLISFLIINWNYVSWIFNYRVVSNLITETKQEKQEKQEQNIEQEVLNFFEKENSLEIPRIGIFVPIILSKTTDQKEIEKDLDLGAVHFFNSALPGEIGETVILGHSSPPGWPKIKHDWIFTRINELENKDEIIIYFNNKKFNYSVTNKFFLEKGEQVPEYSKDSGNVLLLISCWPPGKDVRRIAVEAKLNM